MRQAGQNRDDAEQSARAEQHAGLAHQLLADGLGQVVFARGARDDHARRSRSQKRRHLRREAIADGQNRVSVQRVEDRQPVLDDADEKSRDQIDRHDHHRGDRVAAHELADTVHRGVEVRFAREVAAASARLLLADPAGVEIGVDRHLLARHRIESEARGDFGDAARALGHHCEVDDRDDDEDHDSDRVIVTDDDASECLDDAAGGVRSAIAMKQDEPRRGDIERQAQQRRDQQDGRER